MQKKLSKSTIIIIVVIASLAALLAVFSVLNRQDTGLGDAGAGSADSIGAGTFTVIADGKALQSYSVEDLKSFPSVTVQKDISSGKHDDERGVFTGTPLEEVLDDAAPDWQGKYKEFIFRAEDAFTSSVFASDIEKGGNVLLVYEQDGAPIPGSAEGGKGPIRALIVDDEFGNRSAQMLVSVEMKE
ncbi:MAG: molybdopterin-dependent oxidoreductase [Clostridiales Family XIII bacterium]|jgi:DMSO/TMAO reductase YedYZ molybdopterin-dependent catalytic subunit|nr:molybdopterin-dependent oxidoreductase [Clostridiales Family XIII bacterium]